ncbi:hypothetical protein L596_030464 [Steinernema carpocapsae]|uniref:Uncharacterized protein n=1 Tax=Steinernema carpocapsae TaxID=34508 RepID=A0A4V5ZWZ0_STECR|nr:hypothetical protein L596_030464 [Steinernema carpocapsae]
MFTFRTAAIHSFLWFLLVTIATTEFRYTEIGQQIEGELGQPKNVGTLNDCATYAYNQSAAAILLQQETSDFKCTPFIKVTYILDARDNSHFYFLADLRGFNGCPAQLETVKSITSDMSKCSISHEICDQLNKLKDVPLCPEDYKSQREDRCCPEGHTGNCFELITFKLAACEESDTKNDFKVALARLDKSPPILHWMTPFISVEGGKRVWSYNVRFATNAKQISETTHVIFDKGTPDALYVESILIMSPGSEKFFNQSGVYCDYGENQYRWINDFYPDQECTAYFNGELRTFTLFGKTGVDHVINKNDLAKLKENKLTKLHRSCNAYS